jgi:hypothetical protein
VRFVVFILCGVFFCPFSVQAAYRVYQLKIENYNSKGRVEGKEVIMTTLDPWQYEHYYGGYRWMTIKMVDTWYCPGDTSRREYCAKPKVKNRAPASDVPGQRVELPYNLQPIIP